MKLACSLPLNTSQGIVSQKAIYLAQGVEVGVECKDIRNELLSSRIKTTYSAAQSIGATESSKFFSTHSSI